MGNTFRKSKKVLDLGKESLKRQKLYKESMRNFYMVIDTRILFGTP